MKTASELRRWSYRALNLRVATESVGGRHHDGPHGELEAVRERGRAMAREVRRVFEAATSHVLATVGKNGAPRVSGIEVQFTDDEMTFGSMTGAMKVLDLRRDSRFALHSHPAEGGDAKLGGRVVEVAGPPGNESHSFRLDLELAVYTAIGAEGDHLLVQVWHPSEPVRAIKRY